MDASHDDLRRIVAEQGWAVAKVEGDDDEPAFAYSVGFYESFGHPEVVMFGLSPDVLQQIINGIGGQVRHGNRFTAPGVSDDVIEGHQCAFREVAPGAARAYMRMALDFYGQVVPAVHCIWPDREGRFPWESGTSPAFRRLQPMLSEGPEPYTLSKPSGRE